MTQTTRQRVPVSQASDEVALAHKMRTNAMSTVEKMNLAASKAGQSLTGRSGMPSFGSFKPEDISEETSSNAADHTSEASVELALSSGRDIRIIPLNLIHENPFQPRVIYSVEAKRDRALSIKNRGQIEFIHVIPHPEFKDEFMIGDGWTRVTGCIEHAVCDSLMGEVHHDRTPQEAAWMGYEQNEQREQFCDLDKAVFFDKLYADGATQKQIEQRTGISQAKLSFYASFKKLDGEFMDAIHLSPHRYPAFIVPFIVRLKKAAPDKALAVLLTYNQSDVPVSWLQQQCVALLDKKADAANANKTGRVIRYGNGTLKEKNGKFDLSMQVQTEQRDSFNSELELLLAKYAQPEEKGDVKADVSSEVKAEAQ